MMSDVAGVALGIVMCVAGATKIARGDRWPAEARSMGAPSVVIPFVPWVEIIVGALLVARLGATIAGIVALVMIIGFTGLIIGNLFAGRRPVCACFGAWSTKPLGWQHVVRNVALAGLAVVSLLD